jgi:hypothetical protein
MENSIPRKRDPFSAPQIVLLSVANKNDVQIAVTFVINILAKFAAVLLT